MMNRRTVTGAVAAAAVACVSSALAQVPGRVYRIAYFGFTANDSPEGVRIWQAFVQRLGELGYGEGRNLVIEQRFAEGRNERYAEFAAELVPTKLDLVVASNGSAARAVMAASRSMPIVTTAIPDPVRAGLVASLAHPGGQLTGISNLADELVPKRLELLKAAVPTATRIAFARCPRCAMTAGASAADVSAVQAEQEAAARSLGVKWLPLDVNDAADFAAAAATLRRERPDALLIGATQINVALRSEWLAFAAEQRLPMLTPYRAGAMLSYGPDLTAIYRRAAEYVAKILSGARPSELPMQQPTQFEFVVNLKLAKAIGLTVPPSVLLRADEVIE
jgi:putative ABC transport system substrate-binding protein